jgi:hypothetical protein
MRRWTGIIFQSSEGCGFTALLLWSQKVQNRLRTQKNQGHDDQSVRDAPTSNQYSVGAAITHHITRVAPVDRISSLGAPRNYLSAGDKVAQTSGCHGVAQDVGSPGKGLSLVF